MEEELEDSKPTVEKQESERVMAIHAVLSFVVALGIVLVAIVLFIVLVATKKDPEKKKLSGGATTVRVVPIVPSRHEVVIDTQGAVRSKMEVSLATEVGGKVEYKSDRLVEGGWVAIDEDDPLIRIASEDYVAAEARAKSALEDARLALQQEQAMADQAKIDWKKLGRGEPSDLVLRVPQLRAAEARVTSADAEVKRASRDVERTAIQPPFKARVRMVQVEVGTVLAPGAVIAELYSPDELEVRLPFTLLDYGFLEREGIAEVKLTAEVGGEEKSWKADLDRIDGEVQRSTLSAYGLATIKKNKDTELPPVGLFVEATVTGKTLEDVVLLPRSAVRGNKEVWVAREGELARCKINILRSSSQDVVVRGDFQPGDMLVLTRLAAPIEGMKVKVKEEAKSKDAP